MDADDLLWRPLQGAGERRKEETHKHWVFPSMSPYWANKTMPFHNKVVSPSQQVTPWRSGSIQISWLVCLQKLQGAPWWTKYPTTTLVTWLKGVSPTAFSLFIKLFSLKIPTLTYWQIYCWALACNMKHTYNTYMYYERNPHRDVI